MLSSASIYIYMADVMPGRLIYRGFGGELVHSDSFTPEIFGID